MEWVGILEQGKYVRVCGAFACTACMYEHFDNHSLNGWKLNSFYKIGVNSPLKYDSEHSFAKMLGTVEVNENLCIIYK